MLYYGYRKEREVSEMAKKKSQKIGTISGLELIKKSRPVQDIPFKAGAYADKRKKREKINKYALDKWL